MGYYNLQGGYVMKNNNKYLMPERITAYGEHLRGEERSPGTVEKYLRDTQAFARWTDGRPVTRELAAGWKEQLLAQGYAPVTINSMLAALNGLFRFLGWEECRVKFLKIQRRLFRDAGRELNRAEYERLLAAARTQGQERLALLMETICATGIRVSELQYITVESVRQGQAEICLKGKIRTILIPGKLARKLMKFAQKQKRSSGEIFLTGTGKSMPRRQIWAEMKRLCRAAGVEESKVFPHNLRHLFATAFYEACKDIARLADVLGHSSIETTRIYLVLSGTEHARQMERLGLVS
jgi:integrase/recombinase XerD